VSSNFKLNKHSTIPLSLNIVWNDEHIHCTVIYTVLHLSGYQLRPLVQSAAIARNCKTVKVKLKQSRYRPWMPRGWIEVQHYHFVTSALEGGVWSASRSGRFTPGKDPVPIIRVGGWWVPGPVWTCAKNLASNRDFFRSSELPVRSQSLYRLSYPGPYTDLYLE
jgi:hypothetical protein